MAWALVIAAALIPGETSATEAEVPPARPLASDPDSPSPAGIEELVREVLERNPDIARARHRAAAAAARAPQVRSLPDPMAALSLFVLPPETRVGPQRVKASIHQRMPWLSKLKLQEQAALHRARAAAAEVDVTRLDAATETRRLAYELAFLAAEKEVVEGERGALVRYEKAAQARYAAGTGLQQEIVRIQTQITRVDTRLLDIEHRWHSLSASLNALRDRPAHWPVPSFDIPPPEDLSFDLELLRKEAAARPELLAADAHIAAHEAEVSLAEKASLPDFEVGLSYTLVDRRRDRPGRASPPEGDGDDILALNGTVGLPVRRAPRAAKLEEALAGQREAEAKKRKVAAGIEATLGDLAARLPQLYDHWKLLDRVLRVQAREALRSAETAYSTGRLNAVDLLDAEVVLFEVRIAAERIRADLAIARARLSRALGRLADPQSRPSLDLSALEPKETEP